MFFLYCFIYIGEFLFFVVSLGSLRSLSSCLLSFLCVKRFSIIVGCFEIGRLCSVFFIVGFSELYMPEVLILKLS